MLRGMTIRTLKKALISESNSETIADNLQKASRALEQVHWHICTRDSTNMKILAQDPSTRPVLALLVHWAKMEGLGYEAIEEALILTQTERA